ncbi:dual 3',5'-cyclic-AMP and -GMP phosphodiesterase 11 [Caerostris darwini]|uniref:Dual 3',5'-cyclic-AMP and -GMP phosphodiesterase 11 n=1 Tax=Caerostris darwini TaxID=1538125 RepID=A0AAV4V5I6_9ARAC|nr:dual 3',5'-cyclic-AMP and -GMP phosphodiesterase 11 [Caerostris darwini]
MGRVSIDYGKSGKNLLPKRAVRFLPSELVKKITVAIEKEGSWLDEHPQFIHDYFFRKISRQMANSWLLFHSAPQGSVQEASWFTNTNSGAAFLVRKTSAQELNSGTRLSRSSLDVTWPVLNATYDGIPTFWSRLFQGDAMRLCNSYVVQKTLRQLWDEQELIFKLVNDINTDLGLCSLCLKVLTNISIFTHADSKDLLVSRFLINGERGDFNRCLVRELFNVSCNSITYEMQRKEEICILWGIYIVGHVGEYGESLNISDYYKTFFGIFDLDINDMKAGNVDSSSSFEGRFLITVGITGCVATTEEFTIFCNLGIQDDRLYEKTRQAIDETNRIKVTLEVRQYSATTALEEVQELLRENHIPSADTYKLHDLKFDDFSLNDKEMLKACLRMFIDLGFVQRFRIEYDVSKLDHVLGKLEALSLLIACLCHDLDQAGTNNSFLKKSNSPLAKLYSTSTMEHHHFHQCIMILNCEGTQILSHLSSEEYMNIVHILDEAILATDLAAYYKAMLMIACDIAAITKPWEIQKKIADLVVNEFFDQRDVEKQSKLEPVDMMNRDKKDKLPLMQVAFIDSICLPVYEAFAMILDELSPLLEGVKENRAQWLKLVEEKRTLF